MCCPDCKEFREYLDSKYWDSCDWQSVGEPLDILKGALTRFPVKATKVLLQFIFEDVTDDKAKGVLAILGKEIPCEKFKLVIEGVDGHDPVPHPVSYEYESEEDAVEAERVAKSAGLICFLVTPVIWPE